MRIVIVGAGVVGTALAEQLSREGHHVSVVDTNRRKVKSLEEKLDVLAYYGNGAMPSVLQRVGIADARMCIAVTDVDEVNLVVGMLASRLGVDLSIARLRNPEYAHDDSVLSLSNLGIDRVINPEPVVVGALTRMIEIPGSTDVATMADGQVLMLGFDIGQDSPAAGKSLMALREAGDLNAFLILDIVRGDQMFVPRGDDVLQPGDAIHVLISADTVPFFVPIIHRSPPTVKQVVIVGASRVGISLAEALEKRELRVVMVEPDAELAEEVAAKLQHTTVLNGDGTDLDVLQEASVEHCDLFCALSDDDQRNMLAALLAKKHGATKIAVLVHQPEYVPVLDSLGAEIVINPRLVTVGEILTHVRRGHVHSVTRLAHSHGELIEIEAPPNCPAVAGPLKALKFPRDALVGAVLRDGYMQLPTGDTQIQPGETVVVYALPDAITQIERLFNRKR